MFDGVIIVIALCAGAYLAFSKRLGNSSDWKATVTPLASIMGSGFLVCVPLLASIVGNFALICMAGLLVVAYFVGSAIRFNIRYFEPIENSGHGAAQNLAFLSRLVLAGAYFISVSYYLQLLAAFALKIFDVESQFLAHCFSTTLLLAIGGIGIWKGLDALEKVEKFAVSLNLGVICALLVALAVYNLKIFSVGEWALADVSSVIDFQDLRVLLGLLIVVQGFETSRYLGSTHPAEQRIRTMRRAQLLSSVIYLSFISLSMVLFQDGFGTDVTAIMEMTKPVAVVLPVIITIAAIGSQFSAAVADNAGSGGLIQDLTHKKISIKYVYFLILIVTVALTWETNVTGIISYASRAFALFYAIQGAVACVVAAQHKDLTHRGIKIAGFALISMICLMVFALGLPAE